MSVLLRLPYHPTTRGELLCYALFIICLVLFVGYAFLRDALGKQNQTQTLHTNSQVKNIELEYNLSSDPALRIAKFFGSFDTKVFYKTIGHTLYQIELSRNILPRSQYMDTWQTVKEWENTDAAFVSFIYNGCKAKVFFEKLGPVIHGANYPLADTAFACLLVGPVQSNQYLIGNDISPTKWTTGFPLEAWMTEKIVLEWTCWTNNSEFSLYARVI